MRYVIDLYGRYTDVNSHKWSAAYGAIGATLVFASLLILEFLPINSPNWYAKFLGFAIPIYPFFFAIGLIFIASITKTLIQRDPEDDLDGFIPFCVKRYLQAATAAFISVVIFSLLCYQLAFLNSDFLKLGNAFLFLSLLIPLLHLSALLMIVEFRGEFERFRMFFIVTTFFLLLSTTAFISVNYSVLSD